MPRLASALATCALAWTLAPALAAASPQDLFGYGGRTSGLAMTGTSYAEGYEAVFANPAGLGPSRRRQLAIGLAGGGFDLRIDGERAPLTPPRGMTIGFALPIPFGDVLEDRITIGGAFFTPAEALMRGTVRFPAVPQWTVLDRAQVIAIILGLGVDLHGLVDGLHVGVGVSALAQLFGELDVRLDETNAFSSIVELQLVASYAPTAGINYRADAWGLGLSYRHESLSRLDLSVRARDLPIDVPVLNVGGLVQYDPPTVVLEGYWRPIPDLMVVLNVTQRIWDFYPGPQVPTTDMGRNAPAPELSSYPSPRVAVEGMVRDERFELALRGGYAFEPSPAPPARLAPRRTASGEPIATDLVPYRLLDNHRHVLTAGAGITIHVGAAGERLVIDAFGQLHVLQDRTHEIGRADAGAPMVTSGVILYGGWTARVEF
ncbi:MAG: hypothetical protein KF729_35080 [Sandaracinaceae bacterium]|nr:hypothetical protein [Sandaracinaceae bacterium]